MGIVFQSLLNNTITLYRLQRSEDSQGGWIESYTANGTILGRMWPTTGREQTTAQRYERDTTHILAVVAAGADIVRGDLAVIGSLVVEVQGKRNPSEWDIHYEFDCRERQFETSLELDYLLLESGDFLLLESGDYLILE